MTYQITVNGQAVTYVLSADHPNAIADAQQTSPYKDRAGFDMGGIGYSGYANDVVIYASTRTIANMIYRRHFAS